MRLTVRTWSHTREKREQSSSIENFLFGVELPIDVIEKILFWAKEYQSDLLMRKYKKPHLNFTETQEQAYLIASNQLWKEIQREGFNSKEQLKGVSFLFELFRDNPELIDFQVATQFLSEIEQEEQTA